MQEMFKGQPFSPITSLTQSIGPADTIIYVQDSSVFPEGPNLATIGADENAEVVKYAQKADGLLSGCIRGVEGAAKAWQIDEIIARNFTAADQDALIDNVTELYAGKAAKPETVTAGNVPSLDADGNLQDSGIATGELATKTDLSTKADLIDGYVPASQLSLTASQVGLGNVDNTSDADKPVSTAQAAAIETVQSNLDLHISDKILHIVDLTHGKTGTINNLTGAIPDAGLFTARFKATADYAEGDAFTINDVPYTAQMSNLDPLTDGAFKTGAVISADIDIVGKTINFKAGGAGVGGIGYTMVVDTTHKGQTAPLTGPLEVTYYQEIQAGDSLDAITLKDVATDTPVSITPSVAGRKLTVDFSALKSLTEYGFNIPVGAVKDWMGNVLKGVYAYRFTTVEITFTSVWVVTPDATKEAFDAIIADVNKNGGMVYFTEGEFRGLFPVTITHSDVHFKGAGYNTRIVCDTENSADTVGIISFTGTEAAPIEYLSVEDMVIDGDYRVDENKRKYYGVRFQYSHHTLIQNCVIDTSGNTIHNPERAGNAFCTITNCISFGNSIVADGENDIVSNCIATNMNGIGIRMYGPGIAVNNIAQNCTGDGILSGPSETILIGNAVQNNKGNGVSCSGDVTVLGNTVQNNNSYGIAVSKRSAICGNTITKNSNQALYTGSTSTKTIIMANKYANITNSGTGTIISQNVTVAD